MSSAGTSVSRLVAAGPERVFAELCNGWDYASWIVGAAHIRAVDAAWPDVGSRIHHAVGPWPLLIRDTTEVEAISRPRRLLLRARIWPAGEAMVEFLLAPAEGGTDVTMTETIVAGPMRLLGPVAGVGLTYRNAETLARLAARAERPTGGS